MFRVDIKNRFRLHPQFTGCSIDDIEMLLTPPQLTFCKHYLSSGVSSKAAAETRRRHPEKYRQFGDEGTPEAQRRDASLGHGLLDKPTVFSYLYLCLEEMRKNARAHNARSFDGHLDKMEAIRDNAIEDGDHGSALRAHKEIGILLGHNTEGGSDASRMDDRELIESLAEGNKELAGLLSKQLGIADQGKKG